MDKAVRAIFMEYFGDEDFTALVNAFHGEARVQTSDRMPSTSYARILDRVPQIWEPVHILHGTESDELQASCIEFVLEGLHVSGKLSRTRSGELVEYLGGR